VGNEKSMPIIVSLSLGKSKPFLIALVDFRPRYHPPLTINPSFMGKRRASIKINFFFPVF
jgi:hypothetical protein